MGRWVKVAQGAFYLSRAMNCTDHSSRSCQLCSRAHTVYESFWLNPVGVREISSVTSGGTNSSLLLTTSSHMHISAQQPRTTFMYSRLWQQGSRGNWSPLMSSLCMSRPSYTGRAYNQLFTSKWPIIVQWNCFYIPLHKEGQAGHNRAIQCVRSEKKDIFYDRLLLYKTHQ